LSEGSQRIENLSLTASTPEDFELLAAFYRDYASDGVLEIVLRDGQHLKSAVRERRRSPRLTDRLPVLLLWEEDNREHREHTFTLNVSWYGCAVHSHRFFPPKTPVRLRYEGRTIEARTVFSISDYSTRLVEVGVDFGQDGRDFWGIPAWQE
jgi:hypothetical protein